MMEAKQVSFAYGRMPVLKEMDLTLAPGRLYAVIGPNGSGKTTLIKLLASLLKPASGMLSLNGRPYGSYGRREFARQVALLPQSRNTPDISVYDLVCYGRYPYFDISRRMSTEDRQAVAAALAVTHTDALAGRNVRGLSGGERQRVYMAMLYAQDTAYVLLDEPTTHLDISYGFQIADILQRMKHEGKCVVAVLHDLSLALHCADEVILLQNGRLVSVAGPGETVAQGCIDRVFDITCTTVTLGGRTEYVFRPRR